MNKTRSHKLFKSFLKKILPAIHKILIKFKLNKFVINFLSERGYFSNNVQNFSQEISNKLKGKKIISLDVGAQGGFNSDKFFPSKYEIFFDNILIEPIKSEAEKLHQNKKIINKGLWSEKIKKNLFILDKRLGSSSMYEVDQDSLDLHNIKEKDIDKFKVTRTLEIECETVESLLKKLEIKCLDYMKIDTQGAEFEILKGLGNYRPILIRLEAHIFSMYKNVPSWNKVLNYLYELNYVTIDWKGIGSHKTRIPAEMDMIFVPNFNTDDGKKIILSAKEKFVSLLLIFGQINFLKYLNKKLNFGYSYINNLEDLYFY